MRLLDRLWTGLKLARRSLSLLRDRPRLLVFPALGGLGALAYLGLLFFGADALPIPIEGELRVYALLFVLYFGTTFIGTYATAGLMYCTRQAMRGETPRVGDGFRAASRNLWPLLSWAFISALVGVIIQIIEDSNDLAGDIISGLFALGWTVSTYFVVPVIVFEDVGIRGMFGRSIDTVRETWGESLGAEAGVGLVTVVLVILGALCGFAVLAVAGGSGLGTTIGIVVLAVGAIGGGLIGQALTGIAKTALYVYASEEDAPRYFEDMDFGSEDDDTTPVQTPRFGGI